MTLTAESIVNSLQHVHSFSTAFEPLVGAEGHYIVVLSAEQRERLIAGESSPEDRMALVKNVGGYIATPPEIAAYQRRNP